jgi:1,4-dihydroxy-2-naphthoate octaprenyltransferase
MPSANKKIDAFVLASRPKTLLAAVVPVMIGTSLAIYYSKFNFSAALIALICSVLIQIGTNYVNDLYDFLKGTDTADRVGPKRALASGLLSVGDMKKGIAAIFGLAFILGLYLVTLGGWWILALGIVSILAGIAYTAGPYPLAYNGLGDIFVLIFFGFVATVGTFYVQALEINKFSIVVSIPVGALITNILVVNNYRDIEQDKFARKLTLAVKLGPRFARAQYIFLLVISYLSLLFIYIYLKPNLLIFLPVLSLPIAVKLVKMLYDLKGDELNKTLELTAKFSALFCLLFAIGIIA